MTVARKLVFALGMLAVLALSSQAAVHVSQEWSRYIEDSEVDALRLGRALAAPLAFAAQGPNGAAQVRALTEEIDAAVPETQVGWHWADEDPQLPAEPPAGAWAALQAGKPVSWIQKRTGAATVVAVIPVQVGGRLGVVSFLDDTRIQREHLVHTIYSLVAISLAVALLFVVAANLLGRRIIGVPVAALSRMVEAVGRGELAARAQPKSRDELGALATAFNGMAAQLQMAKANVERQTQAKLEALDRLRHAERLVTVGKLAAGVAHELGTPMNVILGRAKLISSGEVDGESARSSARIIGEQLEAMTGIIHQLLDFARRKQPKRTQAHGFDLLSQTASLLGALAVKSGVTLKVSEPSAAVEVLGDVPALQQVLNNLVMNAVQATGAGGQVTLGAAQGEAVAPDGRVAHTVQLSVQDTGPGVSEAVREHLFEPFFTTKDVGEGTGLGLAVSWGILQDHDGWISVDSAPGRGATFTVHLPVSAGQGSHEPVAVAVGGR